MTTNLARWEAPVPSDLHDPVLVYCLDGWIDAGFAAATAVGTLKSQIRTHRLIAFDTDELLDQRARRPVMRLVNGVNSELRWPRLQLRHGRDAVGQHVLVLTGPEPDYRWNRFTDTLLEITEQLGVRAAYGLGAFPAPTPHTRSVTLGSTATRAGLAESVGFVEATMDIPAGVSAAIERAFAAKAKDACGLWARVPHYVASMPYPAAAAALLECLARLTGLVVDTSELHGAAEKTREQIDTLVSNNDEHLRMVRQLEDQVDGERGWGHSAETMDPAKLPSGDELAAELERFLRGEHG